MSASVSVKLATSVLAITLAAACANSPSPAVAQTADLQAPASVQASAGLVQRGEDLVRFINGEIAATDLFSPKALAQVPAERLTRLAETVRSRRGRALGVNRLEAITPTKGTIVIDFERAQLPMVIEVHPEPPHHIGGMEIG